MDFLPIFIRILVLQAENEQDMQEWVDCLRMANQMALNSDNAMPEPTTSSRVSFYF